MAFLKKELSALAGRIFAQTTSLFKNTMAHDKMSGVFDLANSDLSLCSEDGVVFKVHRSNLSTLSNVFAGMFESSHDDGTVVSLSEKSNVLDRFFRFFYPQLFSKTEDWEMDQLTELAFVSKKYEAFVVSDIVHRSLKIRSVCKNLYRNIKVLTYILQRLFPLQISPRYTTLPKISTLKPELTFLACTPMTY